MDEQRMQAYVGLIEQLLDCPQGNETEILQANADLVDTGLVAVMGQYADWLESQGSGNAGWLRQLAVRLARALGLGAGNSSNQSPEEAMQFGAEMMQLIAQTRGDQAQVYDFFRANLARLDESLLQAVPDLFSLLVQEVEPALAAATFDEFGNLIAQFPIGNQMLNLELAIAAFEWVLEVRTREAMPIEWATSMHNLAKAYSARIVGDKAQNIEDAITLYQQCLQVRTREATPVDWAGTTNNLANAYADRICGDRAQNIEKAIILYQQCLQVMTRDAMPIYWAGTINNLALAYADRIVGDRAQNIEKAIVLYQQCLQVRTREATPVDWAGTMNNLANAYADRIQGNQAQNIEDAITLYQQCLQVRTREDLPFEWATTINNLANACRDRIQGNQAQNIEDAIALYQQCLQVRTREDLPIQWADTMNSLALAYANRICGDHAQNIEDAIALYQKCLQVVIREDLPIEWAQTMNNLANAYRDRIVGDRAQNIEDAITLYQQCLQVRTREAMPIAWAESMNSLAEAYRKRIRGDQAQNIENAIAAYQKALQVVTREATPVFWASIMSNLGNAFCSRIQGDRANNVEKAITYYKQALQVMTFDTMPIYWAGTINNLANAYRDRIVGDRAQNIEGAIALYQQSLKVRTREVMPVGWATTVNNLAAAYKNRIWDDQAQNIEDAINAYQASLEIFTPDLLPDECRTSAGCLANLYSDQQRWPEAAQTYETALQAAETLYQSAMLLDSQAAELATTADLPRRAAYALARVGNYREATLTLERGRARGLSESLDRDRADLDQLVETAPQLYEQYRDLTAQLRNLESQQRDLATSEQRHSVTPTDLRDTATALREQLTQTITEIHQVEGYADFLGQPSFEDIRAALRPDQPLVYLVATSNGSMALIVTVDNIDVLWLDNLTEPQLMTDLLGQTWFAAYDQSRTNLQGWYDAINTGTCQLWDALMGPLVEKLQSSGIERITLIPTGYLSLLPLHAAWTPDPSKPTGRRYALDDLHITYAPNAQSLTAARAIAERVPANSILAINNPTQDLQHTELEVTKAIAHFDHPIVFKHEAATVDQVLAQLPNVTIAHFSCHGKAELTEPLASGLFLSDGLLTLKDIFALNLADTTQGNQGLRLAILSACETGMIGLDNADEAISLPTGLLHAGVAAVIASLWAVSDLSTMLLLTKFYDLWCNDYLPPDQALRQAQIWLRDSTAGEIASYGGFFTPTPSDRPYAHPYHWAAFSYTGI
jgi:CHAT domain-containing protein